MKTILTMVLGIAISGSAFAGVANCGDNRSIERWSYDRQSVESCTNPGKMERAKADLADEAATLAHKRLAKFDGECHSLGGRVIEARSEMSADAFVTHDTHCIGHAISDTCFPGPDYCSISGYALITHHCACKQ